MARLPLDIIAHAESHKEHVVTSAERIAKSTALNARVLAQIEASVARIERARSLKWSMNVPTLPKWIDTLPRRKSISESKNN
jgi:hypothetical protein